MGTILDFSSDQFGNGRDAETIIRINDRSNFSADRPVIVDRGFSSFFVVKAEKGRVNQMLRFNSTDDAKAEFGEYDIDSQGLALFSAYRWLDAGGTAYILRIPDKNYKPATSLLGVEISFKKGLWTPAAEPISADSDTKESIDAIDVLGTQEAVNALFKGLATPDANGNLPAGFKPAKDTLLAGAVTSGVDYHIIPSLKIVNRQFTYEFGKDIGIVDDDGNTVYKFNEATQRVTGFEDEINSLKAQGIYEKFRTLYGNKSPAEIDLNAIMTGTDADTIFIPLLQVESLGWGKYYNRYTLAIEPFTEVYADDGQKVYSLIVIDNNTATELERYQFTFFGGEIGGAYVGLDQVITELQFIKASLLSEQMGIFEGLMRTIVYHNAKTRADALQTTTFTTVVNVAGTKVTRVSGDAINALWTGKVNIGSTEYTIDTIGDNVVLKSSVVDIDGTGVKWKSGEKFDTAWTGKIVLDGTEYNIVSVTDADNLVIGTDLGTLVDSALSKSVVEGLAITLTTPAGTVAGATMTKVIPATYEDVYKESQKYFRILANKLDGMTKNEFLKLYDFFGCRNNSDDAELFNNFTQSTNSRQLDRLSFSLSKGVSRTVFVGETYGDYEVAYLESIFKPDTIHTPPTKALDKINMNNTAFIIDTDYPSDMKSIISKYCSNVRKDISFYRNFSKQINHESLILDSDKFLGVAEAYGCFKDLRTKNQNVRTFFEWCKIRDPKGRHITVPYTVAMIPALVAWRLAGGREAIAGLKTVVSDIVQNTMIPESLSDAKRKILAKYRVNFTELTKYGYMLDSDYTNMYDYNGLMIHPHNVAVVNEIQKEVHRVMLENRHLLNKSENLEEIAKQVNASLINFKERLGKITYSYEFASSKEKSLGYVRDYITVEPYGTLTKHIVTIDVINSYLTGGE